MILDIIFVILLLAILVLIFLLPKHLASRIQPLVVPTQQGAVDTLPEEVTDFDTIREAFIEYIEHNSSILDLDDFSKDDRPEYIGYESGYPRENRPRDIWINVWMPPGLDKVSAVISIKGDSDYFESHYQKLKAQKSKIEDAFSFESVHPQEVRGNIHQLRVEKSGINLTQTINWDTEFCWLRENLEKLYWVLRVHDTLGWNNISFAENASEDDIPF